MNSSTTTELTTASTGTTSYMTITPTSFAPATSGYVQVGNITWYPTHTWQCPWCGIYHTGVHNCHTMYPYGYYPWWPGPTTTIITTSPETEKKVKDLEKDVAKLRKQVKELRRAVAKDE